MGHVIERETTPSPASGHGAGAGNPPPPRRLRRDATAVAALLAFVAATSCASASASHSAGSASGSVASDIPSRNPSPGSTSSVPADPPSTRIGTPYLPKPTGSQPVGTTSIYLKDTSRTDPWVPGAKARELMVSLWYPAKSRKGKRAPYMTPKESELTLKDGEITNLPLALLSKTRTNAISGARPAGHRRGLPLIVLSPGFTKPRSSLTALAEDLASRGYVAAVIGHTYENIATSFPDGRVTTCVACEVKQKDQAFWDKVGATRAADVSYVLDELTRASPIWKGAELINPSRIAMAGHSAGGASAVGAMLKDPRVRAGINIDGTAFVPVPESGLSRPFLFLGTRATHGPGGKDGSWEQVWRNLTGWKRWLVVAGAEHASFTDISVLAEQIGIYRNTDLPPVRSLEITRAYVAAFFDLHLRAKPQPLLDGPSTRYPEVELCDADQKTCA
ncbi:alpha/beta hydrolase family protein [Nonomuraea sp. SYSU D8015]|uniref:alpha/beta hydrolase family protein n=1 Tax=Nonomuraea sp. SYSU D8015 TaxID=2593644 RepID=UPI00166108AF|nr:alpha/beta hydrolase [Nonomuraea sp. SYSU D8015]